MMLKELNLKEVQELRNKDGELGEVASSFVDSMLKGECVMVKEKNLDFNESRLFLVERAMGIEPTSSAWKADILADVRCPHLRTIL